MLDVFGEEDGSGACAEGGDCLNEGLKCVEEVVALEEFEHGGGLTTGHDETVYFWETVGAYEFIGDTDEFRCLAEACEGLNVGGVCALEGEDAYGEGFLCHVLLQL